MKLYFCSAISDDFEPSGLIVAASSTEAEEKYASELDDDDIWHTDTIYAKEVSIEGYEIIVNKI